ncbi:30S ribosomal protein S20 [Patescibacteria group bacterium]|nr:30S ribosomal protein S20 [Patescibacteria group bacterium]
MPIKKSAAKADRRSLKNRATNLEHKNAMKTTIKSLKKAVVKGEVTTELVTKAYKLIDKAAKHHIVHKNNAARKKSRLMAMVNKAGK